MAIILLLASYLVAGVAARVFPAWSDPGIGFSPIMTLVTTGLAFWWYRADARLHGHPRSGWSDAGVLAASLLGVLVYVVKSRRGRQRFVGAGLVIAAAVGALALRQLGGLAASAAVSTQSARLGPRADVAAPSASALEACRSESDDELRPIARQAPTYPPSALFRGIEGHVELRIQVGADGRIISHEVIEAEPDGVFEDSATDALAQWRYCPAASESAGSRETKVRLRFELME